MRAAAIALAAAGSLITTAALATPTGGISTAPNAPRRAPLAAAGPAQPAGSTEPAISAQTPQAARAARATKATWAAEDPAAVRAAHRISATAGAAESAVRAAEARGTAAAARRAAAAGVAWRDCAPEEHLEAPVRCGTVTVPLDYAHPDGRQIALTVSRRAASGDAAAKTAAARGGDRAAYQGALVFNPGGPGATGMFFPLIPSMSATWAPIAAAYDLVGYAPRGVGRSAPLSCVDPKQFGRGPTPAPRLPTAAFKRQRVAEAKAYARGCARRGGDALRHYTTLNNARDLDVLRAALGERRLTFMGADYGAYTAAVYATLFPSHVRRMVFDSPVEAAPAAVGYRSGLARSKALQVRWADFCAWVASHHTTYRLGTTAAQVARAYEKVRAALARHPDGAVGPGQLQAAFLKAAYYDDYWPIRALALAAYVAGDPGPLARQAAPVVQAAAELENTQAVSTAVRCNDAPWPADWRTWDRDASRVAPWAPFATWDTVWANLPCAFWPAQRQRPLDVRAAPGTLPPTLVLAARRDGAAPYAGARELHRRLAGSALVTERGAGMHIIGGGPNACVNAHLRTYLLTGRVPAGGAACGPHPPPKPISSRTSSFAAWQRTGHVLRPEPGLR